MDRDDAALLDLLRELACAGYRFVTPTPETHRRVVARRTAARDLRDIFGWSLPFDRSLLRQPLFDALAGAGALIERDGLWKSRLRVSSIGDRLFLHSAYPTDERDAVFFGPDTYRFVRFLRAELGPWRDARRLVDLGSGSGAGAIMAAASLPGVRLTLTDINPSALRLARINAAHAGLEVEAVEAASIDAVEGEIDLVIANPPYMIDRSNRAYRDGGDMHGAKLSLDWALAAARRVTPGGGMLLYTGSAIVGGCAALREALQAELPGLGCSLRYEELDPDIFGEQLDEPGYADVDRIAAVGAVILKDDDGR